MPAIGMTVQRATALRTLGKAAARAPLGRVQVARRPTAAAGPAASAPVEKAALALALAVNPIFPLAALADDAVAEQVTEVASKGATILGFTPLGLALAASPIFLYGGFYLYREKVNPRATLLDLAFVVAATVIIGNIVSILVFKRRIY